MLKLRNEVNECETREDLVNLLNGLVRNNEEIENQVQVG